MNIRFSCEFDQFSVLFDLTFILLNRRSLIWSLIMIIEIIWYNPCVFSPHLSIQPICLTCYSWFVSCWWSFCISSFCIKPFTIILHGKKEYRRKRMAIQICFEKQHLQNGRFSTWENGKRDLPTEVGGFSVQNRNQHVFNLLEDYCFPFPYPFLSFGLFSYVILFFPRVWSLTLTTLTGWLYNRLT